jgi:hypothetical protein
MAKFTPKPSNHTVPPLAYTNLPKMNVIPSARRDPALPSRIQQPAPQPKPVK